MTWTRDQSQADSPLSLDFHFAPGHPYGSALGFPVMCMGLKCCDFDLEDLVLPPRLQRERRGDERERGALRTQEADKTPLQPVTTRKDQHRHSATRLFHT